MLCCGLLAGSKKLAAQAQVPNLARGVQTLVAPD